jgi:hypothetical protein
LLRSAVIFDLDGVLFDSKVLRNYLPKDETSREEWDLFATHYHKVSINSWCIELIKSLILNDIKILFVTSREDVLEARLQTVNKLVEAIGTENVLNSSLFMRSFNDYRPSDEVKKDIFIKYIKDNYNILFAIDDEIQNSLMWKELEITSLHNII